MERTAYGVRGRRGPAAPPIPPPDVSTRRSPPFVWPPWRNLLHPRQTLHHPRADGRSSHRVRYSVRGGALVAAVLLVVLTGCGERSEHESLLGTWRLDAETQEWVPRACIVLDFDTDRVPGFEVERRDEEYHVRLNDRRGTTFHGSVRAGIFDGRQLLPTTTTGRVCGVRTAVHLRLNLRGAEPGTLRGMWRTPDCGVCPDRDFGALRAELLAVKASGVPPTQPPPPPGSPSATRPSCTSSSTSASPSRTPCSSWRWCSSSSSWRRSFSSGSACPA